MTLSASQPTKPGNLIKYPERERDLSFIVMAGMAGRAGSGKAQNKLHFLVKYLYRQY
jgi:hypothetical protein